jgi:tetratricopeptide (TPR) repeat protein
MVVQAITRRTARVCLLIAAFLLLILSASIAPAQSPAAEHFKRGVARYQQGDWDGAIADFSRVIEQQAGVVTDLDNIMPHRSDLVTLQFGGLTLELPALAVAYYNRALARHQNGDLEAARADFDQSLKLAPQHPDAWLNRGVLQQQMGNFDEAWQDYSRAINLHPRGAEAWYNRGYLKFLQQDYRQALADFNRALALQPKLIEALVNRSVARMQLGDAAGALSDCTQAIRLQPNDAKAWNNRGVIYNDLGQPARALSDFNRALRLDPMHTEAHFNRNLVLSSLERSKETEAHKTQRLVAVKPTRRQLAPLR